MIRTALALAAAAAVLAGCGGSSGGGANEPADVALTTSTSGYKGGTVSPIVAAPELGLRTIDGRVVRLSDYRGRAVLVTFVYTHCPDICPLIVDNLVRVAARLGPDAKRMRIVAVSVDPTGDTPTNIRRFLVAHRAVGKVDYLIGSRKQLEAVWARWGIGARVSKDNPELVEHSGVIWGVDPKGRRVTLYPATGFAPADIEADVQRMLGTS